MKLIKNRTEFNKIANPSQSNKRDENIIDMKLNQMIIFDMKMAI